MTSSGTRRGRVALLIPTFSPQGDGNYKPLPTQSTEPHQVDPYLFPARGRKPDQVRAAQESRWRLIPTFSPQGDGNVQQVKEALQDPVVVDPYLFPARGRKHAAVRKHLPLFGVSGLIPTFSPQGDGNYSTSLLIMIDIKLIPTFSPQGDGN